MSVPARQRVIDLDVARAVALIGVVVLNYHGYLILAGGSAGTSFVNRVFNPWTGPLATRFAATFVMIAGMGVSLMTNRSRLGGDRPTRSEDRWRLIRRGVALYAFGYVFDWIWSGTILFYYGAFFVAGAVLFTLRTRWLVLVGALSALAAAGLQWWRFERQLHGHATGWLFGSSVRSPRGLVVDTFVNGTHPLLPWLAFLCAGMIIGRVLPLRPDHKFLLAFGGLMLTIVTYLIHGAAATTPRLAVLLATDPFDRGLLYTIGTLGSSVAAFCIVGSIAEMTRRRALTRALAAAGRTTLTIYVLHALVFNQLVNRWRWIRPTGLDTAWLLAGGFWLVAIVGAALWQRRFGMGPAERLYRRFGGAAASRLPDQIETPISANVPAH